MGKDYLHKSKDNKQVIQSKWKDYKNVSILDDGSGTIGIYRQNWYNTFFDWVLDINGCKTYFKTRGEAKEYYAVTS